MKKLLTSVRLISIAAMFTATAQAQVAQPGRAGWQTDTYSNCKIWNPIPQAGETVEWFGECKNGYAEGSGQLTWKFSTGNEVWNVNMATGKPGSGPYRIATTHNGTVSTWTGTFASGIKTGVNVRKFSDGTEFEGTWVSGQVNGIGTFKAIDGKKQGVYVINGCIWSAETGGTFINSVDKSKNQCLSERSTKNQIVSNANSQTSAADATTPKPQTSTNRQNLEYGIQCHKTYDSGIHYYFLYSMGGTAAMFKRHRGLATQSGNADNPITARTLKLIQRTSSVYSFQTTASSDGPLRSDDNEQWDLARDSLILTFTQTLGGRHGGTFTHDFSCQKLSDADASYIAVKNLFDAEQRNKKQREENQTQQQLKKNQL